MTTENKNGLLNKVKKIFGGGKKGKKYICMQPEPGAPYYCYVEDGGRLVECAGKGPYRTKEECEAASREG
jgi:hypothetical protein